MAVPTIVLYLLLINNYLSCSSHSACSIDILSKCTSLYINTMHDC